MPEVIESKTETFKSQFRRAVTDSMEQLGEKMEAGLKERLATAYPPASKPGESPHRRTGRLRDSCAHETTQTENGVRSTVYVSARYGGYLEGGTSKLAPRPFATPERDRWLEVAAAEISEGIKQAMEG